MERRPNWVRIVLEKRQRAAGVQEALQTARSERVNMNMIKN